MRKVAVPVLMGLLLVGCGVGRLDQGIIELGQKQSQFVRAWGLPDRQFVVTSAEEISANWRGLRGGFYKGKRALEVWVYESRKTELVFDDKKLIDFKSVLTRQQLQETFVGPKKVE